MSTAVDEERMRAIIAEEIAKAIPTIVEQLRGSASPISDDGGDNE